MNSLEILDKLNDYMQLAANEVVIKVRVELYKIIKILIDLLASSFEEEVDNEEHN